MLGILLKKSESIYNLYYNPVSQIKKKLLFKMSSELYLESYVVPACLYTDNRKEAILKDLIGSAFFINSHGIFVTARHVIEGGLHLAQEKNFKFGLCMKDNHGYSPRNILSVIEDYEFAPNSFDIAVGIASYTTDTLLTLSKIKVSLWQDIAAYGYPINALNIAPRDFQINMRGHKGYIQRIMKPGEVAILNNPDAFETSFVISKGLSGSPLFIPRTPKDIVIGVCVGSYSKRNVESEYQEVQKNGVQYKEKIVKIDEYGIAHNLQALYEWRPKILKGKTLYEASSE